MAVTTIRGGRQITDGTIPYADIQTVTANTILGNNTASATTVQEITLSASQLLGRGTTGNIAPITAGTGLAFSGTSIAVSTNLASLSGLTYSSAAFVKMTAAGTFALDTATYISGAGSNGQISFYNAAATQTGDATFIWDNTAKSMVIGAATVTAKVILELVSVTKGFLPPRMTATQKTAITSPANAALAGLVVFQTTAPVGLQFYTGSAWRSITTVAG